MQTIILLFFLLNALPLSGKPLQTIDITQVRAEPGYLVGPHSSYLLSSDATLEPAAVMEGRYDDRFIETDKPYPSLGFTTGEVWVRMALTSQEKTPSMLLLESRYMHIDELTLFQRGEDGRLSENTQGDARSIQSRALISRTPLFALHVIPGENVYYLRIRTEGSTVIALFLWQFEDFDQHRYMDLLVLGLMFGILVALLFYNGFLAISFQSRTYSYYTGFVLSMIGAQLSLQGIWPYLVPEEASRWLMNIGFLTIAGVTNVTGILVTISFLGLKDLSMIWHRSLQLMLVSSIGLLAATNFMSYHVISKVVSAFIGVASIILIAAAVSTALRGYRHAYFYILAWVFILGANILNTLHYEGIFHLSLTVQYNNFPGAVFETILMSLALGDRVNFIRNRAAATINNLNHELEKHVSQVENLVAERSATIRTILDHVASGFIMIDHAGKVLPGYSRSCQLLLGKEQLEGQSLLQLLGQSESAALLFELALKQVYEDLLPSSVTLSQLPKYIKTTARVLQLEAGVIRNDNGSVKSILFTIQDVTELQRRQRESKQNRVIIKILRDLEAFRQFIASSHEMLSQMKREKVDPRELRFLLHTLKGNCLVFKLKRIAEFIHQIEDKSIIVAGDIQSVEEQFKKFLARHESLLKTTWGPYQREHRIQPAELEALNTLAHRPQAGELGREIKLWIEDIEARPLSSMIQSLIESVQRTAQKLGKSVAIDFEGERVKLRTRSEEKVVDMLQHVLRNAIAHGIEEDRAAAHKQEAGRITLNFSETPEQLIIRCNDDGRGFDRVHWEKAARERALLSASEASASSLTQLVTTVVQGGYSTQAAVSMIAGRGVGLEGFFQAVTDAGGTLELISVPAQGTSYIIRLPRQLRRIEPLAS